MFAFTRIMNYSCDSTCDQIPVAIDLIDYKDSDSLTA